MNRGRRRREVEEMIPVRKKPRPPVHKILPLDVQRRNALRLAPGSRHPEDRARTSAKKNYILAAPCSASARPVKPAYRLRRPPTDGDTIHASIGDKGHVLAIRGPKDGIG